MPKEIATVFHLAITVTQDFLEPSDEEKSKNKSLQIQSAQKNYKLELNFDHMPEKMDFHLMQKCSLTIYFPLKSAVAELLKIHTVVYYVVLGMYSMGVQ